MSIDMATFLLSERLEELVPRLHKQSSYHEIPTTDDYLIETLSDAVKQDVIKYYSSTHFKNLVYINIIIPLYYF